MSIIELFHVTSQSSWASIQKKGVLEPRCGPRSKAGAQVILIRPRHTHHFLDIRSP